MDVAKFRGKQDRIYGEFRDTSEVEVEGFVPSVPVRSGGYLIASRFDNSVVDSVAKISEEVHSIVSSVKYGGDNVHSSLAVYQISDHFTPEGDTLDTLSRSVYAALPKSWEGNNNFSSWLVGPDSVIGEGRPNDSYLAVMGGIAESASDKGIELKLPWGGHMTVGRFLEKGSLNDVSEVIRVLGRSPAIGSVCPRSIDVGHFILTPRGFNYEVFESFKL